MSSAADASPLRGLDRVRHAFETGRETGRRAIMPFVCGGHPEPALFQDILRAVDAAGATAIEIGFPFSDPIADGPVIAAAMDRAISAGATPDSIFNAVSAIRGEVSAALIAMVSVSIVHRLGGPGRFVERAAAAGFDGFIFPDVPHEEAAELVAATGAAGCSMSLLVAPTTPDDRAAAVARSCRGFVYVLARSGITGERSEAPDVRARVATLRAATDEPIAVGFGISTPEHAAAVCEQADAAIVGSALVRRLDVANDPVDEAATFVASLVGQDSPPLPG
ncbi:MAG: tryptophan synthase subunit alpha [Planctomycetota bacterium]